MYVRTTGASGGGAGRVAGAVSAGRVAGAGEGIATGGSSRLQPANATSVSAGTANAAADAINALAPLAGRSSNMTTALLSIARQSPAAPRILPEPAPPRGGCDCTLLHV